MNKIAVLGAGTMGSRVAAHFANAGCTVVLLDISTELAKAGLQHARTAKPPAFFAEDLAERISTGNFEQDLARIADCDWIVEAVAEDLAIKRGLLQRVSQHRRAGSIVSTNTSGLPVAQIVAEIPDVDLKRHWLGVHFFNPPRYMRLVEMIPTPETLPAVVEAVRSFASERLGKTVVQANDTPNFIGNRIGLFAIFNAARLMQEFDLSIEEVDALTGPAIGWPHTGTFRLMDLIGLDVLRNLQHNFESRVKDERSDVTAPKFLEALVERGALGDKSGGGFYKKGPPLLALDWQTLEYHPASKPTLDDVKAQSFSWRMVSELWNYTAYRVPEITSDIASIDEAMRAGFNWQRGPFEMWDAAGVVETTERMRAEGVKLAPLVIQLLDSGRTSWYPKETAAPAIVSGNSSASVIDLGEGVGYIELHSKMNAIGDEIMAFLPEVLAAASPFSAFVIGTKANDFSAGANLSEIQKLIEAKAWPAVADFILRFQKMTQAVKFSRRPVVSAVCGLCLGGGAEVAIASAKRQAYAELSMGLVEANVGLIPGGGGCKEFALLASDQAELALWLEVFQRLITGPRSGSALQAQRMHLLRPGDGITMARSRLLSDAKKTAMALAGSYQHPEPRRDLRAASTEIREAIHAQLEKFSNHDATVGRWLARILLAEHAGPDSPLTEQDYLDAEREAFVALCAEPKTAERIAYTLKTGKPLRN